MYDSAEKPLMRRLHSPALTAPRPTCMAVSAALWGMCKWASAGFIVRAASSLLWHTIAFCDSPTRLVLLWLCSGTTSTSLGTERVESS